MKKEKKKEEEEEEKEKKKKKCPWTITKHSDQKLTNIQSHLPLQ